MIQRFQCGWQVNPGDTAMLIGLLEKTLPASAI